jgi:hypothetical protein
MMKVAKYKNLASDSVKMVKVAKHENLASDNVK